MAKLGRSQDVGAGRLLRIFAFQFGGSISLEAVWLNEPEARWTFGG